MPDNTDAHIATADVLTLLLHNQHAIAAAIEEVALWARETDSPEVHDNAIAALKTLDANASAITAGILKLRQNGSAGRHSFFIAAPGRTPVYWTPGMQPLLFAGLGSTHTLTSPVPTPKGVSR